MTEKNTDMFYKEARKWACKDAKFIIGWYDKNHAHNYIFDEAPDICVPTHGKFKVVRCFTVAGKVVASVDGTRLTQSGVMEFLINEITNAVTILDEPQA